MKLFDIGETAVAHWEADVQSVRMEWKSFMYPEGFREAMVRGVAECAARKALGWIADTRTTVGAMGPKEHEFLVGHLPVTRASGIRAIVTIRPQSSTLTKMSNRRWQKNVEDPSWSIVEVDSLEEAMDYLRQVGAAARAAGARG
jgi:hypothetical protein